MARKADEDFIIDAFKRARVSEARSDDVQVFTLGTGRIAASIDTLVSSTDVPPGMSLRAAARKAVIACVSDFAAKGVRPKTALVSLTLPRGTTPSQVRQIASGIAEASREFDIRIIGGDTNEGNDITISVCAMGAAPRYVPKRSGARYGDAIMVTGTFGLAAAGLASAMSRLKGPARFMSRARRALVHPVPPLEFGVRSSASFTSSMDSSDGLASTLHEMASQSRVRFEIRNLHVQDDISRFASLNDVDVRDLVLYGGEEYGIVFTCKRKSIPALQRRAARLGVTIYDIGDVVRGRGVYASHDTHRFRVGGRGWKHLR